jgi:hypothetical protein
MLLLIVAGLIMDRTTNGVVIADAIKFVQTNKEKRMFKIKIMMAKKLMNLIRIDIGQK